MPFETLLSERVVLFDGAIGTEFYKRGFFVNVSYESLCLSQPDVVREIHQSYCEAGADVLTTNSYAANRSQLAKHGMADQVEAINTAAVELARECGGDDKLVAGSVGPLGSLPRDFEEAELIQMLVDQVNALTAAGADFIMFETLPSCWDVRRAVRAINQANPVPYVISYKVDGNAESPRGESLEDLLKPLRKADRKPTALGLNCGGGAADLLHAFERLRPLADYPIVVQPNAGLPKLVANRMLYMLSAEYFATYAKRYIDLGARGVGGCCGIGPKHIAELTKSVGAVGASAFTGKINVVDVDDLLREPVPTEDKSALGRKLARGEWVTTVEIVPPRGYQLDSTIKKAIQCSEAGVDAINIPDGPRASSRISPMVTARQILARAEIEPILHFCCRDRNLIGMQADLLGCAAEGIRNILFVTGDPPKLGDYAFASAVFDVDSIGIVHYQDRLNRGVDTGGKAIKRPTRALIGVGADPSALDMDREIRRTREKVEAGAEFIISQPVFAVEPLLKFLDAIDDFRIPVIAGIWPLASYGNAEFMRNEVPGVTVPDEIMERMAARESKEDQLAEGIAIAHESVDKLRDSVQGIQVSAPFGRVQIALDVIQG